MEPVFRDILEPNHSGTAHASFCPALSGRSLASGPSWVPDVTKRLEVQDAEKLLASRNKVYRTAADVPQIVNHVFVRGCVIDEIFDVFPLPNGYPFKSTVAAVISGTRGKCLI
jgi:hypothetical protein